MQHPPSGMEPNGQVKAQGAPSPGDLIQQRKDAAQAVLQSGGDGGIFSQLSNNPFFTAVGDVLSPQQELRTEG